MSRFRFEWLPLLQELILTNTGSWCYINANFVSLLWATLQRAAFSLGDLGESLRPLRGFFLNIQKDTPVSLIEEKVRPLLREIMNRLGPRDICEFTTELTQWLNPELISMAWERRITSSQGMEIYDSGTAHQPMALVWLSWIEIDCT